jgi:hypothetical protein
MFASFWIYIGILLGAHPILHISRIRVNKPRVVIQYDCDVKGKAIPLQAWRGPLGSRRVRLPDFKTVGT